MTTVWEGRVMTKPQGRMPWAGEWTGAVIVEANNAKEAATSTIHSFRNRYPSYMVGPGTWVRVLRKDGECDIEQFEIQDENDKLLFLTAVKQREITVQAIDEQAEILNLRRQLLFEDLSPEKKAEFCARLKAMRWTKSWDCPVCGGAPSTIAADGQLKCSDCRHWWKPS